MEEFEGLQINEPIRRALKETGYQIPTEIQRQAIPSVLAGKDVLGCAQTGTGKTAAFAVPILQRLGKPTKPSRIRALILTPTRELALQIYDNFVKYAKHLELSCAVVFGGVSAQGQLSILRSGVDVLVATPGRLWDFIGQKQIDLSNISCFVLDEADRMLDMGFFPDVNRILKVLPAKRQTLLFSATMPPEIQQLADSLLHEPVHITVTPDQATVTQIEQYVYMVDRCNKRALLAQVLREKGLQQTLVFTRTKHGADRVARDLNRAGIQADSIHGDKSQTARQRALSNFKAGKICVLVATDIAARGIDISGLPYVINFDLPEIPETYIHRIGRTGRAGLTGTAISFCDGAQTSYLIDIEELTGKRIEEVEKHAYPMTGETPPVQNKPVQRRAPTRAAAPARTATPKAAATAPKITVAAPKAAAPKAAAKAAAKSAAPRTNSRRNNAPRGGGRRVLDNDHAQIETKPLPARELPESVRLRIAKKVAAAQTSIRSEHLDPALKSANIHHDRPARRRPRRCFKARGDKS